eukprot:COSAG05_NODE_1210_length_5500_cov_84.214960_1_plen_82_part_00
MKSQQTKKKKKKSHPRIRLVMEPRRAPTQSLALTAAELPPLQYPVEPGSSSFKYEEGDNVLLPKPGELPVLYCTGIIPVHS